MSQKAATKSQLDKKPKPQPFVAKAYLLAYNFGQVFG